MDTFAIQGERNMGEQGVGRRGAAAANAVRVRSSSTAHPGPALLKLPPMHTRIPCSSPETDADSGCLEVSAS